MGVVGLLSFLLQNKEKFANKRRLSNTNVVIDSNNLENFLLDRVFINQKSAHYRADKYGGNLVAYSALVKEFFESLIQNGVTPILVVDGSISGKSDVTGLNESGEKVLTHRAWERMIAAQAEGEYICGEPFLLTPRLHHVVYRETVAKLDIQVHQVAYEANHLIIKLANELDCPVIAGDSDFLIYPVNRGFIILKTSYYKDDQSFVDCDVYEQVKFLSHFPGLKKECLPILYVLLGKHPLELGTFERFLARVIDPVQVKVKFQPKARSHRRIVKVLQWLSNKAYKQAAVSAILDGFDQDKKDNVRQFITNMIDAYNFEGARDIIEDLEKIYPVDCHDGDIDLLPAKYLGRLFSRHDLTGPCLNIILCKPDHDVSFLSDFSQPSPYKLEFRPISVAMALLRPKSIDQMKGEEQTFKIFTRAGQDENLPTFDKFEIKSMQQMEKFGTLSDLNCYSMIKLDKERKKQLLMETFHFDEAELDEMAKLMSQLFLNKDLIDEAAVCLLLVKYYVIETKTQLDKTFVASVLMIFLNLAIKQNAVDIATGEEDNFIGLDNKIKIHELMKNTQKYARKPQLYQQIVHNILSLQAIYRSYCMLNNLLDNPCCAVEPGLWFNGPLMYRLMLLTRLDGLEKFNGCCPEYEKLFNKLMIMLQDLLRSNKSSE